ncbi:uncharacterized protein [Halyomorpha halys]|uniref:uncharacterized protein n=1 Tax=Halyomorpha halys TaxID=286706 RepID=UPI0006D4F95C|nr:uncharacterized protein LOC106688033 [Halyomorpha halys]
MRCNLWTLVPIVTALLLGTPPSSPAAGTSSALSKTNKFEPSCVFPEKWQGYWFQSGVRQSIQIHLNKFSTKGKCVASDGDKFLIVEEKSNCHRCVVIHEKHDNVLQYKETYCTRMESLYSLCSHITGDALLYSMFRVNAVPLNCPFSGYHTFSYDRGHGECTTPASTMESCTQESRLILRYQACPDVYGSESAVEELQCLATWKEGSSRYLVGKMEHLHVSSNEDRYRCFVYEKAGGGIGSGSDSEVVYRVAQSGDATCNGLFSPMEGSRTMTLRRANPPRCKFPAWMTTTAHWHSLDYKSTYSLHHRNTSLKVSQSGDSVLGDDSRLHCSEVKAASSESATIIVHFTTGCQSGFMCMVFYRRDQHVIELQSGMKTRRPEEACTQSNFDRTKAPFVTLVTSNPEQHKCPQVGRFSVTGMMRRDREKRSNDDEIGTDLRGEGCSLEFRSVAVGCGEDETMEFRSHCSSPATNVISVYNCHAGWSENGTHYLITTPNSRSSAGAKRYCFIYTPGIGGTYHFSTSPVTCSRAVRPGITGALAFNITHQGLCAEVTNRAVLHVSSFYLIVILSLFVSKLILHR